MLYHQQIYEFVGIRAPEHRSIGSDSDYVFFAMFSPEEREGGVELDFGFRILFYFSIIEEPRMFPTVEGSCIGISFTAKCDT